MKSMSTIHNQPQYGKNIQTNNYQHLLCPVLFIKQCSTIRNVFTQLLKISQRMQNCLTLTIQSYHLFKKIKQTNYLFTTIIMHFT